LLLSPDLPHVGEPAVCVTPLPLSTIVNGALLALLATVTLPLTAPATVGANATVSVTDWPGVSVLLALTPLALNPPPDVVTPAIVTFEFPLFVKLTPCEPLLPTFTFPKLRLAGFAPSSAVAATPVPLSEIPSGEFAALLTIEMFPDAAPTIVGRNVTVIVVCCPALTFKGSENPLTVKTEPVSVSWVMLKVAVPVLVMIKACDDVLPTTPFPRFMEVELTCMPGAGAGFTVSVAAALVTVPTVLLTTTANVDPLSTVVVADVV